jgi:hypothetical protein
MSRKCEVLPAKPAIKGFRFKAFQPACPRNLSADFAAYELTMKIGLNNANFPMLILHNPFIFKKFTFF